MAENKTRITEVATEDFIAAVEPEAKRADARVLDALFRRVTGEPAKMWGPSIIGYGEYHYRYASGHEGDMCRVGFSPRKAKHSLYVLNKLADIDLAVLEEMVALGWQRSLAKYPRG